MGGIYFLLLSQEHEDMNHSSQYDMWLYRLRVSAGVGGVWRWQMGLGNAKTMLHA